MDDMMVPPGDFDDLDADRQLASNVMVDLAADLGGEIEGCESVYLATFDKEAWNILDQQYGLMGLLSLRETMLPITKPNELGHLKFLVCPSAGPVEEDESDDGQGRRRSGDKNRAPKVRDSKAVPKGRYVVRHGRTEIVPGSGKGQWWRNLGSENSMDVLIREEISLQSKELFTVPPGHYVQQAGPAEVFVSGQATGITRMPVLPKGWATVDASPVGGPKYLESVPAAMWQVVFTSGSQRGDIVVREGLSLESDEVSMLYYGAIVEQSGPQELEDGQPDGLIRMPILFADQREAQTSASSKAPRNTRGWVTCDATSQGGPRFFMPVQVPDEPATEQTTAPPAEQFEPPPRTEAAAQEQRPDRGGAGGGRGRPTGGSWDKNRIWRVANLPEDGSRLLAVVKLPEPYAPDKDKTPGEEVLVKWLANGDVVEQVGHSKKSRGYMVMPVKLEARTEDDAAAGGEADGWVTRRLVDRDRETSTGSWFEEIKADGRPAERDRRPNSFKNRQQSAPGAEDAAGPGPEDAAGGRPQED